jgi:hypothetical protein
MSNNHYEHALEGLPCRVSATAVLIYQLICYRYDERQLINNKPNPGYGKSYPGMKALAKATGRSRQACNNAIESLIANNLIARVTIGKPGSRAEYVPIYTLEALGISVKNTLHVSKVYKSKKVADNVKPTYLMSKANLPKETSSLDTISTTSNDKYDKYLINEIRFNNLLDYIPKEFRSYIKPGKNYEKLLDELESKEIPFKAIGEYLERQNWYSAGSKGGLLSHFLEALAGHKRVNESTSMPKWCGGDYCDPDTRRWPEQSMGRDERLTYECVKCHPNQITGKGQSSGIENLFKELPISTFQVPDND